MKAVHSLGEMIRNGIGVDDSLGRSAHSNKTDGTSYHSLGAERTIARRPSTPRGVDDVVLQHRAENPSMEDDFDIAVANVDALPAHIYRDDSSSSVNLLEKFSNIPLRIRGRAEAWEVPRDQIKLASKIGEGTGGVVYLCRWRGLDCAAKLLSTASKVSVEYHDMINEISTISHLRHPNLVLFLGACTVSEPLLILSEYMAGGSLEDRFDLKKKQLGRPWKPSRIQAINWCMDLSRAVCFLHNCTTPIIHRDLKPANLLLSENDHLKVSDFGLCKTLAKVKEDGTPYTMTGCTGTKRYMAPEVVLSQPDYDEKVDIYSMAMIFWYIFKGERPFNLIEPQLISLLTSSRGLRPDSRAIGQQFDLNDCRDLIVDSPGWPELEELVECMWAENPKLVVLSLGIFTC
uniref:Protein kinase domain-containing protein n=1 Tax=Guillardia theta TaxID=55529 RepID=A0A7S4NWZ1_GUITH|mmetsp:Transcript_37130/g.116848  ORF Transcript_37130/g.116848 Transcript_37130/m.116848 type:complete len:403 (+) Transcript_37130:181-1389(+)